MKIEKGKSYNIFYSKGNLNNKKIHIREILKEDNNGHTMIVYRFWNGKYWYYEVKSMLEFDLMIKDGYLINC